MEQKETLRLLGAFAGGIAIGGVAGVLYARRSFQKELAKIHTEVEELEEYFNEKVAEAMENLEPTEKPKYERSAEDDISKDDYVDYLSNMGYQGDPSDLAEMFDTHIPLEEAVKKLQHKFDFPETYKQEEPSEEFQAEVSRVFEEFNNEAPEGASDDEGPEFAEMVANRNPAEPYIIHVNEFMDEKRGDDEDGVVYEKLTLNYYEEDDTLTDEADSVISQIERNIGREALVNFGKFSGDKHTVYVRNEIAEVDFEVIRHKGSYTSEVLKLDVPAALRRMREDD